MLPLGLLGLQVMGLDLVCLLLKYWASGSAGLPRIVSCPIPSPLTTSQLAACLCSRCHRSRHMQPSLSCGWSWPATLVLASGEQDSQALPFCHLRNLLRAHTQPHIMVPRLTPPLAKICPPPRYNVPPSDGGSYLTCMHCGMCSH